MYTSFIKASVLLTAWMLILGEPVMAQQQNRQLDDYIALAFGQNQGLKQQTFDLEKSMFALKEAKALYMPSVSMLGSYTKSAGGRTIDVPVGDLVNPIYTALNQLTSSSKYPQIANQSFLLNPDNFYDLKLRTSLPLINAEIRYNKLIKKKLISSQQAAVNVYKRALVKDIKTAYYHYFQALQGIEAYRSATLLIHENIRVNTSLLRNGVRNGTSLLRAQTELEKNNAALINAQRNADNARAYFNFLLNRTLNEPVSIDSVAIVSVLALPDTTAGIGSREELQQLIILKEVNGLDYSLQRSNLIPKLNTFIDLGSQGTDFKVNDKTRYYLWGVNLQWDIFTGGKNKFRAAQAQSAIQANTAKIEETEQAFKLQLAQAYNNYHSAKAACISAVSGLSFAGKYYRDQLRAYRAGQLLYLELIDAQDQLTSAKLRMADAQADLQITLAELERNQATYPLNN